MPTRRMMVFYPSDALRERIGRYADARDLTLSKAIIVMLMRQLDLPEDEDTAAEVSEQVPA